MELHEAIRGRRSIKKYKAQPISDEKIKTFLESALWAPYARERWAFIVLTDDETKMDILGKINNPHSGSPR